MDPFVTISVFAVGLCFGSFLNVCIYRMPRGLSVTSPRSACPNCKAMIPFYDNVPVLSWLLLGGRCRKCKSKISARYILVELLTAAMFVICYNYFGLSVALLKYATLSFLLIGLIFTDAETKLLPDKLTLTGISLGLFFSVLVPVNDLVSQLLPGIVNLPVSSDVGWRLLSFVDALLGAIAGASFIYGAGAIYLRARGIEGMGFGDVKLMGMIGAFLGLKLTVLTIFAASIAGSIFGISTVVSVWIRRTHRLMQRSRISAPQARRRAWQSAQLVYRNYEMPFGVFLGSMALVALFFGDSVMHWYWGLL